MNDSERHPLPYVRQFDTLRKLIADNPGLPLCFVATDTACGYDYSSTFCDDVDAVIGEVLNCRQEINDEICYTDRDDFEEAVYDSLCDSDESEASIDAEAKRIIAEYEPYWTKCIIVTVSN